MSYLVLKIKSKREEKVIKQIAELLNMDYKQVSPKEYLRQIAQSRKQIKAGKKISLKELENGI